MPQAAVQGLDINQKIFFSRAFRRKRLREGTLNNLYPNRPNPFTAGSVENILNDLASSFSRYAGNQQTAFDNGVARSTGTSSTDQMAQRVERALAQVLGRPSGGADVFVSALTSAFPTTTDGQVMATPSRSVISMYSTSSNGSASTSGSSGSMNGLSGQLPARQAALYRQGSIVGGDAQRILSGLQPFVPEAVLEQVEALRSRVKAEIQAVIDEYGRLDLPRPERVKAYLTELILHLEELGRRAFFNRADLIATADDEAQVASFELLKNYTAELGSIWDAYYNLITENDFLSLSDRVERANILLPTIAQGNTDFEAAMDSVDFLESDRRSDATRFSLLRDPFGGVLLIKPDITVFDLTDWLDRFSNIEGPGSLNDSGQYGLDFVTDQADALFWIIAPIVAHIKFSLPSLTGRTTLDQVLSNERVSWALDNLFTQLNTLADLAVPGGIRNPLVRV